MRLRATVTPTVGALCPFGKARFASPAIDNASASGKFPDVRDWHIASDRAMQRYVRSWERNGLPTNGCDPTIQAKVTFTFDRFRVWGVGTKRQISSTSAHFGAACAPRRTQLSRPGCPQPLLLNKTIPYSFMNRHETPPAMRLAADSSVCTVTGGECPSPLS